ncbi:hypothetical protein BPOR_0707g00050 [Botrytis porri]|uniref:Uncharacterized protein n=1 Tax=Botrytis porri TaxID=87229 RepID=A0A4Z1KAC2_9HELO|nr:hypothetical protein BPOR_0707g00050 [Botrytis porri]
MKTQENHKDEAQIPMRFRILIYALERGITQTAFMQAYNEILSEVDKTEYDLSPDVRQSMIEHQVWTKFFPDEIAPPPLEFPVVEGFFDPPVSRKAVEQYRIWQISYLDSHQNQKSDSKAQCNKMQQSGTRRPIPDTGSVDSQLRYSGSNVIRGGVGGCQLARNIQSRSDAFRSPALVNSEIISIGDPAMDDLTITPKVDNDKASMPNQLIRSSRSTSPMIDHLNQQLNDQQPGISKSEADLFESQRVPV